jgi:hypothetical protein
VLLAAFGPSQIDTQPIDDQGFTKISRNRRNGKRQVIEIDTTVVENENTPSPPPQSPITVEISAGPSESAFPLLPQVEHQAGLDSATSEENQSWLATSHDRLLETYNAMLKEQVPNMINEAVVTVVSHQDSWNKSIEKYVLPLLDDVKDLKSHNADLEAELQALQDTTEENTDLINDLPTQVKSLRKRNSSASKSWMRGLKSFVRTIFDCKTTLANSFLMGSTKLTRLRQT